MVTIETAAANAGKCRSLMRPWAPPLACLAARSPRRFASKILELFRDGAAAAVLLRKKLIPAVTSIVAGLRKTADTSSAAALWPQ